VYGAAYADWAIRSAAKHATPNAVIVRAAVSCVAGNTLARVGRSGALSKGGCCSGHTNLGITSIYLQGIDNSEIIDTVHARRAPMIPVQSSLNI
jgi:hypothetical protein